MRRSEATEHCIELYESHRRHHRHDDVEVVDTASRFDRIGTIHRGLYWHGIGVVPTISHFAATPQLQLHDGCSEQHW